MKPALLQRLYNTFIWNNTDSRQSLTQNQKALLDWFDGGSKTDSGVRVNQDSSLSFSPYWRCVNLLSQTLAAMPLHMIKKTEKNTSISYTHPASYLLRERPNEIMTPYVFRETIEKHKQVWGNGYAIIKRDGNFVPRELQLVHPQYVDIKLLDGELFYEINMPLPNGKIINSIIPSYDMFHLKGPSMDGIVGLSIIGYHMHTLGLGLGAQKFAERFYGSGTNFSGWISMPEGKKLDTDKQVDRLSNSWSKKYKGLAKSHSTPILEDGMRFERVTMPLAEAQFLESRKYSGVQICQICGVPPHKIYDLEKATFNNIEHLSLEYVNDSLLPHATNWEQEIKTKLVREDEKVFQPGTNRSIYYPKYNFNSILKGDAVSRARFYNSALQNGWMNRDKVQELEDMDGNIPGGDKYTVQLNMQELKDVGTKEPGNVKE